MVVLEQASQSLSALHPRTFCRSRIVARCEQQNVPFALVVSLRVIVLNELGNGPPQGTLSKPDQLGQAFFLHRSHPAFSKCVGMSLRMRRMATMRIDFSE